MNKPDPSPLEENRLSSASRTPWKRADLHLIKKWDLLVEGRVMHIPDVDTEYDALAALYRHVGNNFKVGVATTSAASPTTSET